MSCFLATDVHMVLKSVALSCEDLTTVCSPPISIFTSSSKILSFAIRVSQETWPCDTPRLQVIYSFSNKSAGLYLLWSFKES